MVSKVEFSKRCRGGVLCISGKLFEGTFFCDWAPGRMLRCMLSPLLSRRVLGNQRQHGMQWLIEIAVPQTSIIDHDFPYVFPETLQEP